MPINYGVQSYIKIPSGVLQIEIYVYSNYVEEVNIKVETFMFIILMMNMEILQYLELPLNLKEIV